MVHRNFTMCETIDIWQTLYVILSTTVESRDIAKSIHNDTVTWYELPSNGSTMYLSPFGIVNAEDEKPMYATS